MSAHRLKEIDVGAMTKPVIRRVTVSAHKLKEMDIGALTKSIKDFKFHLPDRAVKLGIVKNSGDMFTKMKAAGKFFVQFFFLFSQLADGRMI